MVAGQMNLQGVGGGKGRADGLCAFKYHVGDAYNSYYFSPQITYGEAGAMFN